jgi:hypothetical protein
LIHPSHIFLATPLLSFSSFPFQSLSFILSYTYFFFLYFYYFFSFFLFHTHIFLFTFPLLTSLSLFSKLSTPLFLA